MIIAEAVEAFRVALVTAASEVSPTWGDEGYVIRLVVTGATARPHTRRGDIVAARHMEERPLATGRFVVTEHPGAFYAMELALDRSRFMVEPADVALLVQLVPLLRPAAAVLSAMIASADP